LKRRQTFAFPTAPTTSNACGPLAPGRWAQLARVVGLAPDAPVVVALSGGADSVYLLRLVAAAKPRPRALAVHVDHGLRGEESRADAAFCARLAASLGIPFVRHAVELDVAGPSLEAQARTARYRALSEEAARAGIATIVTGHHADDALETLLHRWTRGTDVHGLAGPRKKLVLRGSPGGRPAAAESLALNASDQEIQIVRPLIGMRREEIRRILADAGIEWREDGSNASGRFTRNRIRNDLIPAIEATCGPDAVENLRAFGAAVEALEDRLAALTAPLSWSPPVFATARRAPADAALGGSIRRKDLLAIPAPIRRRALWRLLVEGTGRAPSAQVLGLLLADLASDRATRRSLPGGWSLHLRSDLLHLEPPRGASDSEPVVETARAPQLDLPFAEPASIAETPAALRLDLPGLVALPDGRQITAEIVYLPPGTDVLRSANEVEIAADDLVQEPPWCRPILWVRLPRPGDRFHPLGAPGSKPLTRFLADVGIPREDRGRIPLVFAGDDLVWIAGVRPAESVRVGPRTEARLRLALHAPHAPRVDASAARDRSPARG
jgi:tRNA(Ile)-lysidine synthase